MGSIQKSLFKVWFLGHETVANVIAVDFAEAMKKGQEFGAKVHATSVTLGKVEVVCIIDVE